MSKSFEVNLDNCHEEPIHIPGSIQPHGILLVVDPSSNVIRYVSENISDYTGLETHKIIGTDVYDIFDTEFKKPLNQFETSEDLHKVNPTRARLINDPDKVFDMMVSKNDSYFLIDLEPVQISSDLDLVKFYHEIRDFINSLMNIDQLSGLHNTSVNEIRKITGFDRVMLYQFDHEYNGEVVSEAKRPELNSFLKQHFPESDIPAQARKLYLKNPIRLIADVNAITSPITPGDESIDLSSSHLRSVSPIHIQYLKNMGVSASMSISIVVEGKLWGLIACHHYSAKVVSIHTREVISYLGLMLSHFITIKSRSLIRLQEARLHSLNASLTERMAHEVHFVDGLRSATRELTDLVNANGVAWNLEGKLELFGDTPDESDVLKIVDILNKNHKLSKSIYHTSCLPKDFPEFEPISNLSSGIIILPISMKENQFLIWFRKEVIHTKNWGGKPEKVIEFLDDGSHRLMPRTSFELWQENVRHCSNPWEEIEISTALKFRNTLINYVLLKSERLKIINENLEKRVKERTVELEKEVSHRKKIEIELSKTLLEAQLSNKELEQFAYVASHDLQEPLRKIQSFGDRLISLLKDNMDDKARDYLARMIKASSRMQQLILDLLSYSRISSRLDFNKSVKVENVLEELIQDLQFSIEKSNAIIHRQVKLEIDCDKSQLYRLFQNLITNSIKFSKENVTPEISIKEGNSTQDIVEILYSDNGIGFDPKYNEKIFGLFERLHGRSEQDGTGLGLAICRKIMEKHNGTITADSQINIGTTFTIRFPRRIHDIDAS